MNKQLEDKIDSTLAGISDLQKTTFALLLLSSVKEVNYGELERAVKSLEKHRFDWQKRKEIMEVYGVLREEQLKKFEEMVEALGNYIQKKGKKCK